MNDPIENHKTDSVDAALADYMRRIDAGQTIDSESFIAEYPQIANELREFLESAQIVKRMAGPPLASTAQNGVKTAETHVSSVGDSVTEKPARQTESGNQPSDGSIRKSFGRYRIEKQLGRGAMGAVYLAKDTQLDRDVALKLPTFDTSGGGEMVKRFYREARAVANLNHAGICPIFDVGKIEETHYISMAYIKGQPLSDLVSIDKPLPIRSVVSLVRKMALALDHAHSQGVIHRDLKPANVMIDERRQPLIMDFGLARRVDKDDQTRLTQDGMILGTPAYMSPEQVQGKLDAGKQSDVYSLGVILYELLTGDLPHKGTVAAVIGQIMTKDAPPPSAKRPEVDADLDAICQQMMACNINDRYASMKAAADALTGYLKGKPSGKRQPAASHPEADASGSPMTVIASESRDAHLQATTASELPTDSPQLHGTLTQLTAPWRQLPPRTKVIATSGLAGLLLVMMGVVIMLRTPYGTLRIEVKNSNNTNISVQIDNKTITLKDGIGEARPTVDKHRLTVLVGETPVPLDKETTVRINGEQQKVSISVSGVELVGDMFNVTRDGKTVLKISLQRIESPAADVKPATKVAGPPIPGGPPVEVLVLPHGDFKVGSVSISSDGEWILTGGIGESTGRETRLWSTRTGRMEESLPGCHLGAWLPDSRGFVTYLDFTPQSRTLRQPQLGADWNSPHNGVISPPAFTPDGSRAIVGSWDKTISVWDVRSRKLLRTLELEDDESKRVDSVAISADGRTGFSYSPFTKLAICEWDLESGQLRKAIPVPLAGARGQFSSGGRRFVGHLYNKICLFDVKTGQTIKSWSGSEKAYHAVAISPQGRYVLAIGEDHVLRLWNAETAKLLHAFSGHTDNVWSVRFSKDLRLAVSASHDGTARVWRLPKNLFEPPLGPAASPQPYSWPADAPPPAIAPFDADQAKQHQAEWAKHLGTEVETTNSIGMKFRVIPPGEFLMGSSDHEIAKLTEDVKEQKYHAGTIRLVNSASPQHRVTLTRPIGVCIHEVTRGQFHEFVEATGYKKDSEEDKASDPGSRVDTPLPEDSELFLNKDSGVEKKQRDEHPAVNVTWNDAIAFCEWLSKKEGVTYRLPTEAEWEFACRAGTTGVYSCGDDKTVLSEYAWYGNRPQDGAHPTGKKKANNFALFDMHGNVWEWCLSAPYQYPATATVDPVGPPAESRRMMRGGAYSNRSIFAGSAFRLPYYPRHHRTINLGFRVVRTFEQSNSKNTHSWPKDQPAPAIAPFDAAQAKKHQQAWAEYLGLPVEKTIALKSGTRMSLNLIPSGTFVMGSSKQEQDHFLPVSDRDWEALLIPSEGPQRRVTISQPFYLGQTEITREQFRRFVEETRYRTDAERDPQGGWGVTKEKGWSQDPRFNWSTDLGFPQTDQHPVVNVSWNDANAFAKWISAQADGFAAGLPTEAQWEFACRAGTTTYWYCGDDETELLQYGWIGKRTRNQTHPVGKLNANCWGLRDMHGNVREWCADWFAANYYKEGPARDPSGPLQGRRRVHRGGHVWNGLRSRSAYRDSYEPNRSTASIGFRLALTIEAAKLKVDRTVGAEGTTKPAENPQVPVTPPMSTIKWTDLFNGKDLTGWQQMRTSGRQDDVHRPTTGDWVVQNGQIVCNSSSPGWLKSAGQFDNFELELEFKLSQLGNSGVYIRSSGSGRLSRTGVEAQVIDDTAAKFKLTSKNRSGAIHNVIGPSKSTLRPLGEWNTMSIRCEGDVIQVTLNGVVTAKRNMADDSALRGRPRSGYLGLANWHGEGIGTAFRNIRIRELEKTAATSGPSTPKTQNKIELQLKKLEQAIFPWLVWVQAKGDTRKPLAVATKSGLCCVYPGGFKNVKISSLDEKQKVAGTVGSRSPFPFCWIDPAMPKANGIALARAGAHRIAQPGVIVMRKDGKPELQIGQVNADGTFTPEQPYNPPTRGVTAPGPIFNANGECLGYGVRSKRGSPIKIYPLKRE